MWVVCGCERLCVNVGVVCGCGLCVDVGRVWM